MLTQLKFINTTWANSYFSLSC